MSKVDVKNLNDTVSKTCKFNRSNSFQRTMTWKRKRHEESTQQEQGKYWLK